METYYPKIAVGSVFDLEMILRAAAENPDYLDESPYPSDEVAIMRRLTGLTPVWMQSPRDAGLDGARDTEEVGEPLDKWEKLEFQTKRLFDALLAEQQNLDVKDNSEKMAFFRTATSLLDKMVGIQERAANLRQIHKFHDTVLRVMENVLDAGQRTEAMDQLREAINPEEKK